MARNLKRRFAAIVVVALLSSSCGYFLYPGRRGQRHGIIDAVTLVMDCLWLIPGVIPGAVALAVDFSSGAIYHGGRRK